MAEALGVVGIVASFAQLIDLGGRIVIRLHEYHSRAGDLPETFKHIANELPVLLDALKQTQCAIDTGVINATSSQALRPAINGCKAQIEQLSSVIGNALPASRDSWVRRSGKALVSFRYDSKAAKIIGVIRDYVQTLTYHATTSTSRASAAPPVDRPIPSSNVPFRRDPNFVDCHILEQVQTRFSQPANRLALVGLGGVGKSQLAVEYSYRVREIDDSIWVFWIHAGTTERFIEGYRKIAERARISGRDDPGVDVLAIVNAWLSDESNGRWLLIVDNADDMEVITSNPSGGLGLPRASTGGSAGSSRRPIWDYIPQSSNGSVLVTSRNREVASRITGAYANIVTVDPMDQKYALLLLKTQLGMTTTQQIEEQKEEEAKALVELLDHMPLAISQAAAYINQRFPRMSMSRYLQQVRENDEEISRLLEVDLGDIRRDGTASNSIILTCQMSFELIHRERQSAAHLLSLMSLFNRQGIPEHLLAGYYKEHGTSKLFEDDLNTLLSFSLIATETDGEHFQMHRLVQYSTRRWLEIRSELGGLKDTYIHYLASKASVNEDLVKTYDDLFPHAQAAAAYLPNSAAVFKDWSIIIGNAVWYAYHVGMYQVVEELARLCLRTRESIPNAEEIYISWASNYLAYCLRVQGKYAEAESVLHQVLEEEEGRNGPDAQSTLEAMGHLANMFSESGKLNDAHALYSRLLPAQDRLYGPLHQDTLRLRARFAALLAHMGQFKDAEELNRSVLQELINHNGSEHITTLESMFCLSDVLMCQQKHDEAVIHLRNIVRTCEKSFGATHPRTLSSARCLGTALACLDEFEDAELILQRTLQHYTRLFDDEHYYTLETLQSLAFLCHRQCKYQEAEDLQRRVLAVKIKVLGEHHPDVFDALSSIALAMKCQGRDDEALEMIRKCLELGEQVLGPNHSHTKLARNYLLAWTHKHDGERTASIDFPLEQAIEQKLVLAPIST
ncbi:TPR-like protein [Aaosphaeria arxii CBS 175.79]|uniref:TPR-like protein n=1 Tax=Aaosphaeria arxii CBS 175.79 TaxID=1450172 RepID=A0A6A5X8H8_9PLEO|nr:TPR-like protein [Aaosphaeria arxii CBS 175.79]KAF2009243.1 TPR-like protein [Aaosphaeria arxii CBS 175.79]